MGKNPYEKLSAPSAADLAKGERELLEKKWKAFCGSKGLGAAVQDNNQRRHVEQLMFFKGMATLSNLVSAHSNRPKPGFFARYFTKEGRAYRQERNEINKLADSLYSKEKSLRKDKLYLFDKLDGMSRHNPFNIYEFAHSQKEDYAFSVYSKQIQGFQNQLISDPHDNLDFDNVLSMSEKERNLYSFLTDYDNKTRALISKHREEMTNLGNGVYETSDFLKKREPEEEPQETAKKETVHFSKADGVTEEKGVRVSEQPDLTPSRFEETQLSH